jgi:hypothetical protein
MPDVQEGAAVTVLTVRFNDEGEFAAARAAEQWCAERGISVGRMDRFGSRGLLLGNYDIAKWHNLSARDRKALHGVMRGDMRKGPVTVTLTNPKAIVAADYCKAVKP